MAKFHGLEGIKRGTIGNITFYYCNGQNLARQRIIYKHDALTDTQLYARGRYCNNLKCYQLLKSSLTHCFEKAKVTDNSKNRFYSFNCGTIPPISRDYFRNSNLPPVGNFISSHGSLGTLDIGTLIDYPRNISEDSFVEVESIEEEEIEPVNPVSTSFSGVVIYKQVLSSIVQNPSILDVSKALKYRYPWIQNGDIFKMYGYFYQGYKANTGSDKHINPIIPIEGVPHHVYRYDSQFTINSSSASGSLYDYGLILCPDLYPSQSTNLLICFRESSSVYQVSLLNTDTENGIGTYGATIVRNSNDVYYCSSCEMYRSGEYLKVYQTMQNEAYKNGVLEEWKDHYKKKGKL